MSRGEDRLDAVAAIARAAGRAIVAHLDGALAVEYKADDSPLTQADRAAHHVIVTALGELTPAIPVLSEESPAELRQRRRSWERYWLVDPLDGTKELLKGSGEFTVNIALIEHGAPVLGVVHVPVTGTTYAGGAGGASGAWVEGTDRPRSPIATREADLEHLAVVASRDHAGPLVRAFVAASAGATLVHVGSALKLCLVAEGRADLYPRDRPTMEWDTAAAQAILEAAGGRVTDLGGASLRYTKDDLRNPPFLAFGDPGIDWPKLFAERTASVR